METDITKPWEGAYMSDAEFGQFLADHVEEMERLRQELQELADKLKVQ